MKKTLLITSLIFGFTQAEYLFKFNTQENIFIKEDNGKDIHWDNVILYVDIDTESNTIIDRSKLNKNISVLGPVISNERAKFGNESIYFNSNNAQELRVGMPSFSGDFTVEMWINTTEYNLSSNHSTTIIDSRTTNSNGNNIRLGITNIGRIGLSLPPTSVSNGISSGEHLISNNNWHHIAFSRENSIYRLFVDGVLVGERSNSTTVASTTWSIGKNAFSGVPGYYGYLDGLRVTNGVARYTSNFNVPTREFPKN